MGSKFDGQIGYRSSSCGGGFLVGTDAPYLRWPEIPGIQGFCERLSKISCGASELDRSDLSYECATIRFLYRRVTDRAGLALTASRNAAKPTLPNFVSPDGTTTFVGGKSETSMV